MKRVIFSIVLLMGCSEKTNEVEDSVREILIDPDSAKFFDIVTENGITCGIVNSKNEMGGYSGRRTFTIRDGRVSFLGDDSFAEDLETAPCSMEAMSAISRAITKKYR